MLTRTKTNTDTRGEKPTWKKLGGGSLRIGKQIIKPGQTFKAYPEEIALSFRKYVAPVSGDAVFDKTDGRPEPQVEAVKLSYTVKPAYTAEPKGKNGLWFTVFDHKGVQYGEKAVKKEEAEELTSTYFNVVDGKGKVVNQEPLKKEVAEKLVKDLLK